MMYHLSYLDIKHGIQRGGQIDPPPSISWFSSTPAGIGLKNRFSKSSLNNEQSIRILKIEFTLLLKYIYTVNMYRRSQMIPENILYNTTFSFQLPYISGHSLQTKLSDLQNLFCFNTEIVNRSSQNTFRVKYNFRAIIKTNYLK